MIVHGVVWEKDRVPYTATTLAVYIYSFREQGRSIDTWRSIQGEWLAVCMLFATSIEDAYMLSYDNANLLILL